LVKLPVIGRHILVHVGMKLIDIHIMTVGMSTLIVVMLRVLGMLRILPLIIIFSWKIAVVFLVITWVAETSSTVFDEAQADSEDDIEAWRKLDCTEKFLFLEHFEIASQSQKTIRACLMLRAYSIALSNTLNTPIS
jgi:hypothetical protein